MPIFDLRVNCCLQMQVNASNRKEADRIAIEIVRSHFSRLQEIINNGNYEYAEGDEIINAPDDRALAKIVAQIEDLEQQ